MRAKFISLKTVSKKLGFCFMKAIRLCNHYHVPIVTGMKEGILVKGISKEHFKLIEKELIKSKTYPRMD